MLNLLECAANCVVLRQGVEYVTRNSCHSLFIRKDRSGGSFVTVAKILTQMVDRFFNDRLDCFKKVEDY
jgi:hypothetical protein